MSVALYQGLSCFRDHCIASALLVVLLLYCGFGTTDAFASDWEEDVPKKSVNAKSNDSVSKHKADDSVTTPVVQSRSASVDFSKDASPANPLRAIVEKEEAASTRIQRPSATGMNSLSPKLDQAQKDVNQLDGSLQDHALDGTAHDASLKPLNPLLGVPDTLQGKAELLTGKGARGNDPDQDDVELMVEWDRWHNRFLRAVQLGTQEILNNPDPEDVERRFDPHTGAITGRYPLGTAAAFSCVVTGQKQIRNLELIEPSGFSKYDRAVLRAVQQLAGTQILVFPKGSHRPTVIQPGRIKTANSNDFKYYKFGDVEHVRHP